jgi:hypothetical protein
MSKLLHTEQQLLHDWAVQVVQLFNGEMCYQVGSSMVYGKYRDVDVRTMLDAKDFKKLQKLVNVDRLNLAISLWGQKVTGMPIDFQVQDVEYANVHHTGMRSAVGIGGIAKGDGYADTKVTDLAATYSKANT